MADGLKRPSASRLLLAAVTLCGGCMTVELPPPTEREPREPLRSEREPREPPRSEREPREPPLSERVPREPPPSSATPPPIVQAPAQSPPARPPKPATGPSSPADNKSEPLEPEITRAPPEPAPERRPLPPDFSGKATAVALGMLGRPYRLGGITPDGFDCSGLIYYSFGQLGVSVPRDTQSLRDITAAIPDHLRQVGDLVFFHIQGRRYSHVGLYVGEGRFLHAPAAGGAVRIEKLSVGYWTKRYAGTRRMTFAPVNSQMY